MKEKTIKTMSDRTKLGLYCLVVVAISAVVYILLEGFTFKATMMLTAIIVGFVITTILSGFISIHLEARDERRKMIESFSVDEFFKAWKGERCPRCGSKALEFREEVDEEGYIKEVCCKKCKERKAQKIPNKIIAFILKSPESLLKEITS